MIAKSCNETRFRLFWDALYNTMIKATIAVVEKVSWILRLQNERKLGSSSIMVLFVIDALSSDITSEALRELFWILISLSWDKPRGCWRGNGRPINEECPGLSEGPVRHGDRHACTLTNKDTLTRNVEFPSTIPERHHIFRPIQFKMKYILISKWLIFLNSNNWFR